MKSTADSTSRDRMRTDNALHRAVHGACLGAIVAALVFLLMLAGAFEPMEMVTLDARFKAVAGLGMARPPDDIVVIAIDQNSLESVHKTMAQGWPWPRIFYGRMLDYLAASGARAVVFDMLFTEPDISRMDITGEESDSALVAATRRSDRAFHAFMMMTEPGLKPDPDEQQALLEKIRMLAACADDPPAPVSYSGAALPSAALIAASRCAGFVTIGTSRDNVCRVSSPFVASWEGNMVPSLPFAVAWDLTGQVPAGCDGTRLTVGKATIPILPSGESWLWWYAPLAGSSFAFPYVSAYGLLRSCIQAERGQEPDFPADMFKDKIVLIGSTAPALFDPKATPLSHAVPGVEIQATSIANLLHGDAVVRSPPWISGLAVLIVCVLLGVFSRIFAHAVWNGLIALIVAVVSVESCIILLAYRHVFTDLVPLLAGPLATYVAAAAVNYLHQRGQTRLIRHIFEHYLDGSVIRALLADPAKVRLGGERRSCTVLFSDVANFTQTSERMPPEEVVRVMNMYLDAMTEIILAEGGFVDKFVGDEIVAIFGAPQEMPDHAARACRAALRMSDRVRELQPVFLAAGCAGEVFARTGLSTGDMVVGNMGSEKRMNYTGMGDTMNLGARIEGTNKVYGTRIMVSSHTAEGAGDAFLFRELDAVRVKGRMAPESLFELLCDASAVPDDTRTLAETYSKALVLYRQRSWTEAIALFRELSENGDGPSAMMLARCEEYMKSPPPPAWDGTYTMTTK